MVDLVTFVKHVQDVLGDENREPHWTPQEAEKYMADYGARRRRFEELAQHLNMTIVSPRLETVAGFFVNASMQNDEPANRSSCFFEYYERFPAITRLEFAVEHDVRFEKLTVHT